MQSKGDASKKGAAQQVWARICLSYLWSECGMRKEVLRRNISLQQNRAMKPEWNKMMRHY
ncbi:hypothetical protein DCC62_02070 [candidate division KSB1 bacterium]|nr:MAG: hypothetical protein DCC62_02070 [candidate division KSB1 bacterium]